MTALFDDKKTTVKQLLNKLAEIGEGITWRINNSYSSHLNETVLEIQIFENRMQTGRIAFQLENGHVINFRYKALEKTLPVQIVDMLLDAISYELAAA
mgnify:CR=1 FL=1